MNIELKEVIKQVLLTSHPVGSLFFTKDNRNPDEILFGGGGVTKWKQIEGRFIYGASASHPIGQTGGEESHTLTVGETPAHSHTRGTMEITGNIAGNNGNTTQTCWNNWSGAFHTGTLNGTATGYVTPDQSNTDPRFSIGFTASKGWTGETSSVGNSQPHNNLPPFAVYAIWERIE